MGDITTFLFGLLCLFLIGFACEMYSYMERLKYIKQNIVDKYGKSIDIEEVNYKMDNVSSYFINRDIKHCIDDITWNDLSMDDIYKTINNTQSSAGYEVLYNILREPLHNKDTLLKRDSIIEYFRENEQERKDIQFILGKLGISKELYVTNCLYNKSYDTKNNLLKYQVLSSIPIISFILIFINGYFIVPFILSMGVNVVISQRNQKYNYNIDGFTYIIASVNTARKIKDLKLEILEENLEDISKNLKNVARIRKKSVGAVSKNMISEINVFSEYINMIFLSELKQYEKVKRTVIAKSSDFIKIYDYIGMIDALIGIASFRDSLNHYSKPTLTNQKENNFIDFVDIYHPLIKDPITNSGKFKNSVLLTGSNASGKSTFIKTIAINAILAQTIYTTCSNKYLSSYFNIYTSMALKDDIFSSESYYIVEIKSLKRIIDNSNKDIPCLCFVDEILRGTNTIERISASSEVLSVLNSNNTLCFAATHDIELTHILQGKFENYHFEEIITDKDIKFDYKLYRGRAQTKNAIKLLEFMGYNKDIVDKANKRAEKFLIDGKW